MERDNDSIYFEPRDFWTIVNEELPDKEVPRCEEVQNDIDSTSISYEPIKSDSYIEIQLGAALGLQRSFGVFYQGYPDG